MMRTVIRGFILRMASSFTALSRPISPEIAQMRIALFSGGIGLESAVKLLAILSIKPRITVRMIERSQLRPLFSIVRSDCLFLAQIRQRPVCGDVHRADDGRLNVSRIKESRQMIITEN